MRGHSRNGRKRAGSAPAPASYRVYSQIIDRGEGLQVAVAIRKPSLVNCIRGFKIGVGARELQRGRDAIRPFTRVGLRGIVTAQGRQRGGKRIIGINAKRFGDAVLMIVICGGREPDRARRKCVAQFGKNVLPVRLCPDGSRRNQRIGVDVMIFKTEEAGQIVPLTTDIKASIDHTQGAS